MHILNFLYNKNSQNAILQNYNGGIKCHLRTITYPMLLQTVKEGYDSITFTSTTIVLPHGFPDKDTFLNEINIALSDKQINMQLKKFSSGYVWINNTGSPQTVNYLGNIIELFPNAQQGEVITVGSQSNIFNLLPRQNVSNLLLNIDSTLEIILPILASTTDDMIVYDVSNKNFHFKIHPNSVIQLKAYFPIKKSKPTLISNSEHHINLEYII